jgi:hypothetical protein
VLIALYCAIICTRNAKFRLGHSLHGLHSFWL